MVAAPTLSALRAERAELAELLGMERQSAQAEHHLIRADRDPGIFAGSADIVSRLESKLRALDVAIEEAEAESAALDFCAALDAMNRASELEREVEASPKAAEAELAAARRDGAEALQRLAAHNRPGIAGFDHRLGVLDPIGFGGSSGHQPGLEPSDSVKLRRIDAAGRAIEELRQRRGNEVWEVRRELVRRYPVLSRVSA